MPGETATFYIDSPYTLLTSQTTDAAGNCTLTDLVAIGQYRCVEVVKPGWTFSITNSEPYLYPDYPTSRVCTGLHSNEYFFWGQRVGGTSVKVIGGARGYVNPNRNETATIVFAPPFSGLVTIKIYNARGNLVVTKTKFAIPKIQNTVEWDARNAEGQKVASGIYTAHVSGSQLNYTIKIAVVRK